MIGRAVPTEGASARVAPTPRDTILADGTARLLRFRSAGAVPGRPPVLCVPSMINRWYVMDLREGVSLAAALVEGGHDTWLLDWGVPEDEDRYRTWDDAVERLARMVRRVKRETGAERVVVLGYCMGATLSSVYAALHPDELAALINLAGPIDFEQGGLLRALVDEDHFDPRAMTSAGNLPAEMMQSGFVALGPTGQLSKWVALADRGLDPEFRAAFDALEAWAGDNIPFPGACYVTYIEELYQKNRLAKGELRVRGRAVDLRNVRCPVLTIVASRDTICPPEAATALNALVGSERADVLEVPGGHVGAVVGSRAPKALYPKIVSWIHEHARSEVNDAAR
ncbi:MAG: alpha/beta fold hydrolase [Sandaracinaceae bacterium]|nr:alpha/beta fold hydrolase [Sandaracinaceae bacterium]